MKPKYFANQDAFRTWLEKNHMNEKEVIVGFYKVDTGKRTMTWSESVDQALCFGWIDGIRRAVDGKSYCIRFTPRKPTSRWSSINVNKVKELTKKGLMRPPGLSLFNNRKKSDEEGYSFNKRAERFPAPLERVFKAHDKAWAFFSKQAPSYRRTIIHWVTSAKKKETQRSRLERVIVLSTNEKRLF